MRKKRKEKKRKEKKEKKQKKEKKRKEKKRKEKKEIRDAFRRLALQYHADRGGENEQFIKIKQAYEDLKIGKKYPETDIEKIKNSRVYSGDRSRC